MQYLKVLVKRKVRQTVARFVVVLLVAFGVLAMYAGPVGAYPAAQAGPGESPPATPAPPVTPDPPGVGLLPDIPLEVLATASTVAMVIPQVVTLLLSLVVELVPSLAGRWDMLPNDLKRAWRAWAAAAVTVLTGGALLLLGHGTSELWAALGIGWLMSIVGAEKIYELLAPWLPRKQPDEDEGLKA